MTLKNILHANAPHFKNSRTLRSTFLLITIILMILFGIGTSTISYIIYSDSLSSNAVHSTETNLQFMCSGINSNLDSILNLALWSKTNTAVINYISSDPEDSSFNALTREAGERLSEEYLGNPANAYISRIIITNSDNTKYLQRVLHSYYSVDHSVIERIKELPYFDELISAPDYTFSIGVQNDPLSRSSEKMLPIIRPIESLYSSRQVGFLYIQIDFKMFTDPLTSFSKQSGIPAYLTIGRESYLIDKESVTKISQTKDAEVLDYTDMANPKTVVLKINGTLYVSSPLNAGSCWITVPVTADMADASLSEFMLILLAILIFVTVIGLLLIKLLSNIVSKPVALLQKQLAAISMGDFRQNPDIEWNNELGQIGHDINLLATDIEHLLQQRIADEKEKKDQEYQMLQSQINPHFLYNTLNSIKWMASAQHADGIAEMTTALAHLMKSISKGTSTIVSVEDEFHLLDDYFTIQKYRYGGAITLKYHVESPELLRNQILRFTLQPIVENAIFHGIEPKGSSGHIDISLYKTEQMIRIDITDDGVGMNESTIRKILSGETADRSSFFKQLGISSVNKRLHYTFGGSSGLTIKSTPGEYTCVSILLPDKPFDKPPL